ncbi:MFS transporter [Galbitalea sp. SE-J8]|nr:MFS transporter [Galbitalea sp. SE-J8]MDM4762460.1 MFS transporter [Galbitalea sp. SE-J8]
MRPRGRTGPRAWLGGAAALVAVGWGGNEFTPLLVLYRQADGLTALAVDVLLGVYVLGIVPGLLLGGPLSDRYGRRPFMHVAAALCVLGSGVLALGDLFPGALLAGRLLSGLALGVVMAVGTSWVKELSEPPFDPRGTSGAGARRASLALTVGFGTGAVAAALLAQFSPLPEVLPYAVNVVATLAAWALLSASPETRARSAAPGRLRDDLRVPAARHRRFLFVVVPMAPWVFGSAASAYAVLPVVLSWRMPGFGVGAAGLFCFVAIGAGVLSQQAAKRIDSPHSARAIVVALAVAALGMGLAAVAAFAASVAIGLVAAAALGAAYGLLLVSGLLEVQRIAGPDDLAGLTAVYYSISYLGFFVPAALAIASVAWGYPALFLVGVVAAAICCGVVALRYRAHLPLPR